VAHSANIMVVGSSHGLLFGHISTLFPVFSWGAYDTSRSEWETVILLSVGGGAFWDIAGIIPSQGSVTKLGIDRIIDFSHLISHIGILE
jgi:hypothetical protein